MEAWAGLIVVVVAIFIVLSIVGSIGIAIDKGNWLYSLIPLCWLIFGFPVSWIALGEKLGEEREGLRRLSVMILLTSGIILSVAMFLAIIVLGIYVQEVGYINI